MSQIKIGINGFGRIGRLVFRAAVKQGGVEVVGINDLISVDYMAYMLRYDTVHGHFDGTVEVKDGTLTSDDTDLMLILDGIDMKGSVFTLNHSFGYFIKDNICLGVRFGYTRTQGTLGHVSLNLGSANDISMSLSDVGFKNRMTTMGAFMRSYAGVDPKGHFGLFGELELMFRMGTSVFSYAPEGGVKSTDGSNMQVRIAFSSGVAVYIFPNVCCTLSFGLGGFQFSKVNQKDAAGNVTGSRQASKLLLRLNLADIKIGLNFHL